MSDKLTRLDAAHSGHGAMRGLIIMTLVMLVSMISHVRAAGSSEAAIENMLRVADAVRHPIEEGVIHVRATVEDPGEEPVVSLLDVYVRGRDHVLSVFRDGPLEGRRILTVGEKVWLLIPNVARPIPISANQRLLGGVSITDIARLDFASEYHAAMREEDDLVGDIVCRVLDLKARTGKAAYAAGTLWVGREDGLPKQVELILSSGKPAKIAHFDSYELESTRPILERMRIVHLLPSEHGMQTILEFTGYEPQALADDFFDPARARDTP